MTDKQEKKGRPWTVSVAFPSSIVDNAQSEELKSYLVGQIARTLCVFNIDEVIVYDEYCISGSPETVMLDKRKNTLVQTVRILEYLECPQYLRKSLFPIQKCLRFAGLLNPLESTHHYKEHDDAEYREGVVLNKPPKKGRSFVNVGLQYDCMVDRSIQPNVRVTVKMTRTDNPRRVQGVVVSPNEPRQISGLYWGYQIRMAHSLHDVFDHCPFVTGNEKGYDLKIGTSDRGDNVDNVCESLPNNFKHLLIVFGGLRGIEAAHESDDQLCTVMDTKDLFDFYLNTCPGQGSDTIRTEEAMLITLSSLRPTLLNRKN